MERFTIVVGRVVRGAQEGRKTGYPTANFDSRMLREYKLDRGVYAALALTPSRTRPAPLSRGDFRNGFPAAVIVGVKGKGEAHYIGRRVSCYGKYIAVLILKKIRPLRTFARRRDLIRTIRRDIRTAQKIIWRS